MKQKEEINFLSFTTCHALSLGARESSSVCMYRGMLQCIFLLFSALHFFFSLFKGQVTDSEPLSQELALKVQMKLMTRDNILMLIRYFMCLSSSEQYCSFMYYMKAEL